MKDYNLTEFQYVIENGPALTEKRLKKEEQALLGWSPKRELAKINYRIHTDAIKVNFIPPELTPQQTSIIYAAVAAAG